MSIYTINDEFINSRLDRWFRRNVCDVPQSLIEKNIDCKELPNKTEFKPAETSVI